VPVYQELDQRWRLLVPPETLILKVGKRGITAAQVRALPAHTPVALVGGRRLRGLARRSRMSVRAEYLALPSLATPVAITQITREPLRWTTRTVLTVPSGIRWLHAPAWAAIRLVRAMPRLLTWAPAGDRILVGTRS
jgi:hypothetical protein